MAKPWPNSLQNWVPSLYWRLERRWVDGNFSVRCLLSGCSASHKPSREIRVVREVQRVHKREIGRVALGGTRHGAVLQRHQGIRHHNREQGDLPPSSLKAFEEECPLQHALSRVGGIASILSDGAHNHILRSAMLGRPHAMPEARSLLPFVRLSCGQLSTVENKGILKLFCSPSEFRRHSRKW